MVKNIQSKKIFGKLSMSIGDLKFMEGSMSYIYSPEIWNACLSNEDQLAFDEFKKTIEIKLKVDGIEPQKTNNSVSVY